MIDVSSEIRLQTTRSGGKGGQNVNKVETAVIAYFDVFSSRYNRNIYTKITPGTVTPFSQFGYTAGLADTIYIRRVRSTVNLATLNNVSFLNRTYTLYFKGDGTISTTTNPKARSLATIVHK